MKKIDYKIISGFVILILLIIVIFMWPFKSYKIMETRNFSCQNMTGFAFSYPIFKDWEPGGTSWSEADNTCIIFLNYPDDFQFEVAPQIRIKKEEKIGLAYIAAHSIEGIPSVYAKKSPKGIIYDYIQIPEVPDSVQFYSESFGVRINLMGVLEKGGFSRTEFWKQIIDSFRFENVGK